jgi:hypothetical protein
LNADLTTHHIEGIARMGNMGMEPAEAIALLREKRCDAVLCNSAFEQWLRNQ